MTRITNGARLGPYEIRFPLGAGGLGAVWLATEVRLARKIDTLDDDTLDDDT